MSKVNIDENLNEARGDGEGSGVIDDTIVNDNSQYQQQN
jgi:hypothetical protein